MQRTGAFALLLCLAAIPAAAREALPLTFAHADHRSVNCIDCHHNFADTTGQGLCLACHRNPPCRQRRRSGAALLRMPFAGYRLLGSILGA